MLLGKKGKDTRRALGASHAGIAGRCDGFADGCCTGCPWRSLPGTCSGHRGSGKRSRTLVHCTIRLILVLFVFLVANRRALACRKNGLFWQENGSRDRDEPV